MAGRAGRSDGKHGHTDTAYGGDTFNMKDGAFLKGLENTGYEYPDASHASTVDAGYGKAAGVRGVVKSGTTGAMKGRMKNSNDPVSAKTANGTKNKRYK